MNKYTRRIPSWAVAPLVNCDSTGLNDFEEEQLARWTNRMDYLAWGRPWHIAVGEMIEFMPPPACDVWLMAGEYAEVTVCIM